MKEITIVWINRKEAKAITTTPGEVVFNDTLSSYEPEIPAMGITPDFRRDKERARKDFFDCIVAKIENAREIVIFGSDNTKEEFLDFLNQNHQNLFSKVIGVEASLDMPEEKIIARGRKYL